MIRSLAVPSLLATCLCFTTDGARASPPTEGVAHQTAVAAANRQATLEPTAEGFLNGVQVYPYMEGAIYHVITAPERVTDIALQPGETRQVTLAIRPESLALWNREMKRVVEPGTFTIMAGGNSQDVKSTTLTVTP